MKILKWLGAAVGFFFLLVIAFIVLFLFQADEEALTEAAAEETLVSSIELEKATMARDSLQVNIDSLLFVVAQAQAERDSIEDMLIFRDASILALESRLTDRDVVIEELRAADVNAQEMARTFSTMNIEQLSPIVSQLTDGVVLDIYKYTSNKRRRFLLEAMGDDRAAKLTNELVTK